MTWVKGVVRDATGRPVEGVSVIAYGIFYGGLRMYENVQKGTTDQQGRYEIHGESGLADFSCTMVAYKPGLPPALAWMTLPEPPSQEYREGERPKFDVPSPQTIDFNLSSVGGMLDAAIVQSGQPVAGVNVGITLQGANLRDQWARGTGAAAANEARDAFQPVRVTDAAGIAHFTGLIPGAYSLLATSASVRQVQELGGLAPTAMQGHADSVSVRAGELTRASVAISPPLKPIQFRIQRHDGLPLTGRQGVEYGSVVGGGWNSSVELDADGAGQQELSAGLNHLAIRYRSTPLTTIPIPIPYFSAEGVVAGSALLDAQPPVLLRGRPIGGAALAVRVLDPDGRPIRSAVVDVQNAPACGSTDEAGDVRFEGIRSGYECTISAQIPGESPLLLEDGRPFPTDAQLLAHASFPSRHWTPQADEHKQVELRQIRPGYIRGTVKPLAAGKEEQRRVSVKGLSSREWRVQQDAASGRFVLGPLEPSLVSVVVLAGEQRPHAPQLVSHDVTVEAGKVTAVDLVCPPVPKEQIVDPGGQTNSAMLGMGGITQYLAAGKINGNVLLADGKTPAHGAMVVFYAAEEAAPSSGGMIDAAGHIRPRGIWFNGNIPTLVPRGSPNEAIAVAWLPGTAGAAIVPLPNKPDQPLHMVLPPAVAIRGQVTIDGRPATSTSGQVRLMAEYSGKGKLDSLLSVFATAQSDGSFELAGLTPGHYSVQAALDDIWLSTTLSLDITNVSPPPQSLDIPAPGGPARLLLRDTANQPIIGARLTIDRPAGPLTALLWPPDFTTDGNGAAYFPALEAGHHVIHYGAKQTTIEVPPLQPGSPVVTEVVLGDAK